MKVFKRYRFLLLTLFLFGIFQLACRKSSIIDKQRNENISEQEIKEWFKNYIERIPNAPIPDFKRMQKLFFKDKYIVKVPLKGSLGKIFFSKTDRLDVQYIRVVPKGELISFPFNGAYEYIDMNTYEYRRVDYLNGKAVKIRVKKNKPEEVQPIKYQVNSWFSQLLKCIGQYIFALPKRDGNGDWTECWGIGGEGGSSPDENQEMQPGDGGGGWGNINWFDFFENDVPPSGSVALPGGGTGGGTAPPSSDIGASVDSDEQMSNNAMNQDILDYFIEDESAAKPRPAYASMIANALPAHWSWVDIANHIGSEVKVALTASNNTCATRVSYMLNRAGSLIPPSPWTTFEGNDNKNYIVQALTMLSYLKSAFGSNSSNTVHLTSTSINPLTKAQIQNALAGKQGIFVMIPLDPTKASGFGASGHVDLLDANGSFASGHDFSYAKGGVKEIYLFILN